MVGQGPEPKSGPDVIAPELVWFTTLVPVLKDPEVAVGPVLNDP